MWNKVLTKAVEAYQVLYSYLYPSRVYKFEMIEGYVHVRGWDGSGQEEVRFIMTTEHFEKALGGVPVEKSRWVFTPAGLFYLLEKYMHNRPEHRALNRVIAVLCHDKPLAGLQRTLMMCLNLGDNIPVTEEAWQRLCVLDEELVGAVELLRGDMTVEKLR